MARASIPLQLGLLGQPEISHFGLYSADRSLVLSVTCSTQGTLSDLLASHAFRSLLPPGSNSLECRFFQCNEFGVSDYGICIDHGTQLADLDGYWIVSSFDIHSSLVAAAVPQPSAPPEELVFDSGPIHPMHDALAHQPHQALEHEPLHAGASAPPLDPHYDDAAAHAPPPARGDLCHNPAPAAPSSNLTSDRLLSHQVQSSIRCPLTLEPFDDPVIASDGHTYERSAIMQLFNLQPSSRVSPLTREPFENFRLIPNYSMRSLVRDTGHVRNDNADIASADISLGSFNNYVDLGQNDLSQPLLAGDFPRDLPRGMGLANQVNVEALPVRLREKTSGLCCNYAFIIFLLCALACVFNASLSTQLQSITYFNAWQPIFDSQQPLCFYLSIALSIGAFLAVLACCPLYVNP